MKVAQPGYENNVNILLSILYESSTTWIWKQGNTLLSNIIWE